MKITLYTITDCQYSQQEKAYFLSKNLTFEEKNLETNREFLTEMLAISNNFAGTPVTKIEKDDGQIVVLKGFTQDEFDKALGFAPTPEQTAAPVAQQVAPAVPAAVVAAPIVPPVVEAVQPPVAVVPPAPVMPVAQPVVEAPAAAPQLSPSPLEELQTTMNQPIPVENPSVAMAPPVVEAIPQAPIMPPQVETQAPAVPSPEPAMPTVQPAMPAMPQDQALNDILNSLQAKVEDPAQASQSPSQVPANPQPTV